jgi:hypothetical protein
MKFVPILFLILAAAPLAGQNTGSPQPPAAAPAPSNPPSPHVAQGAAAGTEGDIRDIRGPIHIPNPWMSILASALTIAAAALAYELTKRWMNRAKVRIKLPHELALERIEKAGAFIDAGQSAEFAIEVSAAVRAYIETIFQVHAPRKTTEEFLHDLLSDSLSILTQYSHLLEDFLQHCDLAKFAKWPLSKEEMEAMRESAKRFVAETARPKTAAVKSKEPQKAEAAP